MVKKPYIIEVYEEARFNIDLFNQDKLYRVQIESVVFDYCRITEISEHNIEFTAFTKEDCIRDVFKLKLSPDQFLNTNGLIKISDIDDRSLIISGYHHVCFDDIHLRQYVGCILVLNLLNTDLIQDRIYVYLEHVSKDELRISYRDIDSGKLEYKSITIEDFCNKEYYILDIIIP